MIGAITAGLYGGGVLPPTPPPVSGYKVWLDASYAGSFTYSSGSLVSQWTDLSANAYTFTQATTTKQPDRSGSKNGKATLKFDGTNDRLLSTAAASTWTFLHNGSGATVFTVFSKDSPSNAGVLYDTSNTATSATGLGVESAPDSDGNVYTATYRATASTNIYTVNPYSAATYYVMNTIFDQNNGTVANRELTYMNTGSAVTATVNNPGTASTANPYSTLSLGALGNDSLFLGGYIAEIIMYPSVLNSTDRVSVRDYLIAKWGI